VVLGDQPDAESARLCPLALLYVALMVEVALFAAATKIKSSVRLQI